MQKAKKGMPVILEVRDERKQLGSRLPPELLKHLRATAVEQDTTVTKLVIEAVTRLIGQPKRSRKKQMADVQASAVH
jgi:antitoxin-like ribbon-helix-helix protein